MAELVPSTAKLPPYTPHLPITEDHNHPDPTQERQFLDNSTAITTIICHPCPPESFNDLRIRSRLPNHTNIKENNPVSTLCDTV